MWLLIGQPLLNDDTQGYLANDPMRSAAYPLFLDLFHGPALLPLQLLLFAAAVAWFVHDARPLPLALAILSLALIANPYVWELQATVMTEALTTPLQILMAGALLTFALKPSFRPLAIAALLGGLATTIRPQFLPFIVAPVLAAWLAPRDRLKWSAAVVLLWLAPVAIERAYSNAVHGERLTSPMGRALYLKSSLIDVPAGQWADPRDERLDDALVHDYAPARSLVSRARDPAVRLPLQVNYESCAAYGCLDHAFDGFSSEAELERHLFAVGLQRLRHDPLTYLRLTAQTYLAQWLLHPRKEPTVAERYSAFVAANQPLPFADQLRELAQPTPQAERRRLYTFNRIVFAGLGASAFVLPLLLLFYRPNAWAKASLVLLAGVQAVLVVGAFFSTGQPRYPMGLWPPLIVGVLLGLYGLAVAAWGDPRAHSRRLS